MTKINTFKKNIKNNPYYKKLKKNFSKIFKVFYKSFKTFSIHSGSNNAGFIAFSVMFAIFPFMIFFMTFIGFIGQKEIGIKMIEILKLSLPKDIINTLLPVIDSVLYGSKRTIVSIASLSLLWSASSLVQGLKSVLDKAFRIKTKKSYIIDRIMSVFQFMCIMLFIILSIFFTIIFPRILQLIDTIISINHYINIPFNFNSDSFIFFLKPFLLVFFLFLSILSIYYIVPSQKQKIKNIFWGTLFTLFCWLIALKILVFYIEKIAKFQAVYGTLAGIIITLYFFQIMSIILILGAELNYNIVEEFYKKKDIQSIDI